MKVELVSKNEVVFYVIISFLFFVSLIYCFHGFHEDDKLLEQNPVYSSAVIVDIYWGVKGNPKISYEFVVNGKDYDGSHSYSPHLELVNIGDTCEIVYAESNPEISRVLTDDNHLLKIKRIKKEREFLPMTY